ncbi:hypothetical protein [Micromonospora sp. WMMD714]|uniref:hypothetical protein n=1 Tax=Micromonospora sp. WMMD714 TaxID=3016097 RepID=UPI00249AD837|nr:hypothetical protein [Micromonospora sp. WMMD714]WFE62890.1 hypothetical protein O7625_06125 [Micromonospora sp. WMMD714]
MIATATMAYLATRPWELGDVATWIGALANIATVILALAAALVGYRVYKVESGRDARAELERRAREADERRSQASLVAVWYGQSAEARKMLRSVATWVVYDWGAWIVNASQSPVYDAVVRFYRPDPENTSWVSHPIRVVPPYRGELLVNVEANAPDGLTDGERHGDLDVSLEFRDAAGRYWLRDRSGYLHELPRARPGMK